MKHALGIFGRYPRRGEVKTRLQSFLGPEACLTLHQALLLDTLERTSSLDLQRCLYLSSCSKTAGRLFVEKQGLFHDLEVEIQHGSDLGERLRAAFQDLLGRYDRAVIVGSDSPTLPISFIDQAFVSLEHRPVVLGPAEDGGYYLIGLSLPRENLFSGIDWGTGSVLDQTREKLRPDEYFLLPVWYDIDTREDLLRLSQDLERHPEGFPRRTGNWVRSELPSWSSS